jgi:hypothetical protein
MMHVRGARAPANPIRRTETMEVPSRHRPLPGDRPQRLELDAPMLAGLAATNIATPMSAALMYASVGWYVLPVDRHKVSLIKRWGDRATIDAFEIRQWWARWPGAWVAVATGRSALLVVDLDGSDGAANWEGWTAHRTVPGTPSARTPHGRHLYLAGDGPSTISRLARNVDTRGRGGYIVAPGSPGYAWLDPVVPLATVPGWLDEAMTPPAIRPAAPPKPVMHRRSYADAALWNEDALVRAASVGRRNPTLSRAAANLGQLVGAQLLAEDRVCIVLEAAGLAVGLSLYETRNTIASGMRFGKAHPRGKRAR